MSNILIKKTVISLDDFEKYISNDTQTINSLQNNFDIKQYIQKLYKYATFFVAYSDSQIIGMLCGYFNNFITKEAYISYLSVLKPFQRKNVGTLLLKEAYTYAQKQGFKNISLEVLKNNLAGIRFYKKNHYAKKNENENSFIMYRKVLPFNILITGASGVLAKKLIKKIKDNNFNVIASTRDKQSLNYKEYGVEYINNDDIIATDVLKNVDLIINCAFPRKQEPEILAGAIQFFDCLIMRAVEMNVKSFINISSQSVYPSYRQYSAKEIDDIKPADNYGLTKYACEIIGCTTVQNSNTNFTNIRLASLIGKEYPERVINKIIKNAIITHKISINNDKNVFGYFDVDEAVEGIFEFIKNSNPENWDKIYNLGTTFENQEDFKDIAIYIQKLLKDKNIDVELEITEADRADKLCLLDSEKFYEVSKWKPELSLKESIKKIMEGII